MGLMRGLCAAMVIAVVTGCESEPSGGDLVDGTFTEDEWSKVKSLSPLPELPVDTTNRLADDPKAATLGQRLFFEKGYSGPIVAAYDGASGSNGMVGETGKVACVSCHQPENDWIDKRSKPNNTSLGANWVIRNASSIVNASYYTWLENDGLRDSQWSDSLTDPEDGASMNGSRLRVAHVLFNKYRAQYDEIFTPTLDPALDAAATDAARFPPDGKPKAQESDPDGPWEMMTEADQKAVMTIYANFGKAMQAYLRKLVSKNSPFDRYVAGDETAITTAEKRGLKLFVGKAGCIGCHSGPLLSDNKFHTPGMEPKGDRIDPNETGRYGAIKSVLACEFNSDSEFSDDRNTGRLKDVTPTEEDKGKWRTKGLREIGLTAPYMHTGQVATLKEVVEFYNRGGDEAGYVGKKDELMKPLNLTAPEVDDLVAFMKTLTGEPISAALSQDTSAQ
jgi:cytochrome c peroxidase